MFCKDSQVQQKTSEEGWRAHWLKCCVYNNKEEDSSLYTLNNINY